MQWKFLFTWIIANTIGITTGVLLFFIVFVGMQVNANAATEDFISTVIGMAASGASNGAAVGLCQWTILRREISGSKWWIGATIAGMAIGTMIPASIAVGTGMSSDRWDFYVFLGLGTAWITASIIQGLVLKQYTFYAVRWVLASTMAGLVWGIGTVVGLNLFSVLLETGANASGSLASAIFLVFVCLILGGGITGSVLVRLLKNARNRR